MPIPEQQALKARDRATTEKRMRHRGQSCAVEIDMRSGTALNSTGLVCALSIVVNVASVPCSSVAAFASNSWVTGQVEWRMNSDMSGDPRSTKKWRLDTWWAEATRAKRTALIVAIVVGLVVSGGGGTSLVGMAGAAALGLVAAVLAYFLTVRFKERKGRPASR